MKFAVIKSAYNSIEWLEKVIWGFSVQTMTDFYYIVTERWEKLSYFPTKKIEEIKNFVSDSKRLQISKSYIFQKNFGEMV